jgi:hypothetical protein
VILRPATLALLRKELRELLPLWAVAMAGLGLMGLSDALTPLMLYFVPSAILGTLAPVALGAMSMGHEYRYGTLTSLLSLPVSRRRVLATKAVVLGSLLIMLAGFAWWLGARTPWLLLPLALAFGLAPWFTLLTRSELAGMVFAGAMPALFLLVGELMAEAIYGSYFEPRGAAYLLRSRTVGIGTAVLCAIAIADTVRRFLSLQVIDGGQRASSSPSVAGVRAAAVPRRQTNVYVALLKKELRLQALPIVVVAVVSTLWLVWPLLPAGMAEEGVISRTSGVLQPLFAVLLAILSGALASADERHLGVWSSQVLLPVPMWKQWMGKATIVLGLAFTFGLVLTDIEATRWRFGYPAVVSVSLPVFAVGAAALSLFVSSLSSRGVIALLVSVGAVLSWMIFAMILIGAFWSRTFFVAWQTFYDVISPAAITNHAASIVTTLASGMMLALPIVVVVWLALRNHRRLDHQARLVRRQVAAIALVSALSIAGTAVAAAFEDAVVTRNRRGSVSRVSE